MPNEEDDGAKRRRTGERGEGAGAGGRGERPVEVAAVVDRVEDGGVAVLSLGDGRQLLDLPLSRLPEGTRDGDHLRLTFDGEPSEKTFKRAARDARSRADAAERVRKLQERLGKGSGTAGKKDFKL